MSSAQGGRGNTTQKSWKSTVLAGRRNGHTLAEVGAALGVTRERVRQYEEQLGLKPRSEIADEATARLVERIVSWIQQEDMEYMADICREFDITQSRLARLRDSNPELETVIQSALEVARARAENPTSQECISCLETKSPEEFHRDSNRISGLNQRCKTCVSAYQSEYWARKKANA